MEDTYIATKGLKKMLNITNYQEIQIKTTKGYHY